MNEMNNDKPARSGQGTLLIILAIVALPMLLAYVMWSQNVFMPSDTNNKGELILPPLHFDQLVLHNDQNEPLDYSHLNGKWALLSLGEGICGESCRNSLYLARQVNTALGREANRVTRLYVDTGGGLDADLRSLIANEYPRLETVKAPRTEILEYIQTKLDAETALAESYLFVVDPLGNIMLYFTPEHSGKDILTDMKKLLKNSKIG